MRLINILFVITLLAGCTKNLSNVESENEKEIRFRTNIQDLQVINLGRSGFSSGDNIYLYISEREKEDVPMLPASEDLKEMVYDVSGNLSFKDQQKHIYPDVPIDVYGYYWKKTHTAPLDLATMPVCVNINQSTEDAVKESDLLYVKAANGYVKDEEPIHLEFEHLFSRLVLKLRTETSSTLDLEKLEEVKVWNMMVDGTLNLGTGILTGGNTVDEILMQKVKTSPVIILPQSVESNTKLFTFKLEGKEEFAVNVPKIVFEKGKEYCFDVLVNEYPGMGDVDLSFSLSVKDWVADTTFQIVIENGEKARVELTDVAEGVVINKADFYLSSGETVRVSKGIAVVNNKMEFMFPRTEAGGTLKLDSARFYTDSGEEFGYYFKNMVLKGNNRDKVALTAPQVGEAWAGGTIFVVGEITGYDENDNKFITDTTGINAYRGRIVTGISLGMKSWCTVSAKGKNSLVGANSRYDGMINLKAVEAFAGSNGETLDAYPAFKACKDLGEGWYYPALNEIRWIAIHKKELNINMEAKSYGSSTEKSEQDCIGIGVDPKSDFPSDKGSILVWPVRAY